MTEKKKKKRKEGKCMEARRDSDKRKKLDPEKEINARMDIRVAVWNFEIVA